MSDEEEYISDMVPDVMGGSNLDDVLMQVMAAKHGDPNQFQSFWEMDEEGVNEATMEEIQNDPAKKILWAAENNLLDTVKELLETNSELIKSQDEDGYTALHRASYNGHTEMVMLLLQNGADVHSRTNDGWCPLHSASRWNQAEVISILLQHGCDINAKTNSGQTSLHLACSDRDSRSSLEILLMNKNIDTSLKNSLGETAFDICQRTSENCLLFEIAEKSVNIWK